MAADGEIVEWCFFGLVMAVLLFLAYKYRHKFLSWWHNRKHKAGEEGIPLVKMDHRDYPTVDDVHDVYHDTNPATPMEFGNQPDEQKPSLLNRFTSSWNKLWGK